MLSQYKDFYFSLKNKRKLNENVKEDLKTLPLTMVFAMKVIQQVKMPFYLLTMTYNIGEDYAM